MEIRGHLLKAIAGLLILACGVSACFVWKKPSPNIEPFDSEKMATLQVLPHCELRRNPSKYNGKLVKIDAKLHWFMHGYYLQDKECSETVDTNYLDSSRTAVVFEKSQASDLFKQLRELHSPGKLFTEVHLVAIGRFTYGPPKGYSDGIDDRTPFRFELYSLDEAKREKNAE